MALVTGGAGSSSDWGLGSPTYNPATGSYESPSGLVYVGTDAPGTGTNTETARFITSVYYSRQIARSRVSSSSYNRQRSLEDVQKNVSAEGQTIPLVYGAAQVGGQIFAMGYNITTKTWTIGYIVALGEIQAVDSILINGEAPVSGVLTDTYTGQASQTFNAKLAAAITDYDDDMVITHPDGNIGIAYVVVQYKDSHYTDWPKVTVNIRGRKVWNPSTSTTVFSENPALHLADLCSNSQYGQGYAIDNASLITLQDRCDSLAGGETRRKSYTVIDTVQSTSSWIEILRGYAGAFLRLRGDTVYFEPDMPATSVMTIGMDDIVKDSITIRKKDSGDVPTVVRASYTDTSDTEWRERLCTPAKAAGVDAGTTPWRESRIRLVGVTRHSQAYRECVETLNQLLTNDLSVEWVMFDEGMKLEAGDVVTLNHVYGLTNKTVRITNTPEQVSAGRWRITAQEYSAGAYSDQVVTDVNASDTGLPSTIAPAAPTGLTADEIVYTLKDNSYASRLDISWTAPAASTATGYTVEVRETVSTDLVWSVNTSQTEASSGPLKEGVGYTVTVRSYNALYIGAVATLVKGALIGKNSIPAAPTGLVGSNNNGDVRLYWTASADPDVFMYEVRYYATTENWDHGNAVLLDQTASLTFTTVEAAPGSTWRFGVKSIDSVGQYSTDVEEVDVAVSVSSSGITTFYANGPTGPNANAAGDLWFELDQGKRLYYATAAGTGSWVLAQDSATAIADAAAAAALANAAQQDADAAAASADGKVQVWVSNTDPGAKPEGDMWMNPTSTPANEIKVYKTGTGWIDLESETITSAAAAAANAEAIADGKITTYYASTPPTSEAIGDLWVNTSSSANHLYRAASAGADQIAAGEWISVRDSSIATAQAAAEAAQQAAADAEAVADGKVYTWVAGSAPGGLTATDVGDLWINTASSPANQLSRWSGTNWVLLRDAGISEAYNLADGKITSYYQTGAPSTGEVGDIWIDTSGGLNVLKYCTSTGPVVWTSVQDSASATALAETKNTVYRSNAASTPVGADEGDLWIKQDDNNSLWRYESSTWVPVTDTSTATTLDTVVKTQSFTAARGKRYPVNTTGGTFTMTLPNSPSLGDEFYFFDYAGTFWDDNLIIARAASAEPIMGEAESMYADVKNYSGGLMYASVARGWVLI